jgi:hypothetical protein
MIRGSVLRPNPKAFERSVDARRRAKLVVWLSAILAVMSLAFAYALYMQTVPTAGPTPAASSTP